MSIIPPPLSRRSSIWSILRSLDTLSPPPSWPSLDNLAACCQVGSIPVMLYAGVEERVTTPDDNLGLGTTEPRASHESSTQGSRTPSTAPWEGTWSMKTLPRSMPVPPPQPAAVPPVVEFIQTAPPSSSSTPASSPERPRYMAHKDFAHSATQRPSIDSSPETTGRPSGTQGHPRRGRNGSTSTTGSGSSCSSNSSLVYHDNVKIGSARFPLLPVSLSWLRSTTLEVMIDQEGFRTIKPIFKLAGYSRPTAVESGAISLVSDFMPLHRKSFIFHHSALDTPPVLRRLMVNGDGSHDYLSRQAYLILKANGPFTVQGTEPVQSSRLFHAADPPVLSWRRTEAGKVVPGEKILTPLSFSCSPALLQSTQAKKIRVVHVVKKSMEPPMAPFPCPVPAGSSLPHAVTGRHSTLALDPSTHDRTSTLLLHGASGACPPLSSSPHILETRVGEGRAI
ncbi:hypothetical protein BC826DRAFT_977921, partial [Russula brevipes]